MPGCTNSSVGGKRIHGKITARLLYRSYPGGGSRTWISAAVALVSLSLSIKLVSSSKSPSAVASASSKPFSRSARRTCIQWVQRPKRKSRRGLVFVALAVGLRIIGIFRSSSCTMYHFRRPRTPPSVSPKKQVSCSLVRHRTHSRVDSAPKFQFPSSTRERKMSEKFRRSFLTPRTYVCHVMSCALRDAPVLLYSLTLKPSSCRSISDLAFSSSGCSCWIVTPSSWPSRPDLGIDCRSVRASLTPHICANQSKPSKLRMLCHECILFAGQSPVGSCAGHAAHFLLFREIIFFASVI